MRKIEGFYGITVKILAIFTALIHLYAAGFGVFPLRVMRSMHLMLLLPICFIIFPANKKSPKKNPTLFDLLLAVTSIIVALYVMINYKYLQIRWLLSSPVLPIEIILGSINILLLLEATRRVVTPILTILSSVCLLYLFVGPILPGMFYHSGFSFARIVELMYLDSDNGIYGLFTGISATYVIIFVIFGSFLRESKADGMFNDLALAFAGGTVGGPAKVAVVSSGLFGMISGMGTANVYATGSFTIPLMKKMGYRPQFASAVEAVASTGGQLMPPILGMSAFVMSEIIGIPYIIIAKTAVIIGVLYFLSIGLMVHWEAVKEGLKGLPKKNLPNKNQVIKKFYMFLPILVIVYFLIKGYSPLMAGEAGIISTILVSFFRKDTFLGLKKILNALERGAKNTIMIAVSSACAGIIVSVIINSGLGLSFGSIFLEIGRGMLLPQLFFTMVLCIILGFSLPAVAAYIISATLAAPILIHLGIPLLTSHIFCFYFAIIGEITPPVAVVAYAAANISGSDPVKTGFEAAKLATSAFILPFAFVYDSALLVQGNFLEIFISTISAIVAIYIIVSGVQGYFIKRVGVMNRIVLIIYALLLLFLQGRFKVILLGLALVIIIIYYFIIRSKNKKIFI